MQAIRNPNLGPSQMRARRRRLFFVRFCIILFFILVIIFGLAIFSGHDKVKIKSIIISGNAVVSSDAILAIADQDMVGRYAYLFSKRNSLIFPRFQIKTDLLREIKIIKSVDISWKNWQKITIFIEERKPHSVWCGNDMNAVEPECFFMDKEGYIYGKAPIFSGSMYVKAYGRIALGQLNYISQINPIGSYFLPKETYSSIFSLIQELDQKNIKVISIFFDGFDYRFTLEDGPEIIFNNKKDFNLSFANLFIAMETKNLDLAKDGPAINYIDLRFDNKIVVGKKEI